MKTFLFLPLFLLSVASALAEEQPFFTIVARYEGFDPLPLTKSAPLFSDEQRDVDMPRVTTRAGQRATIEIIQENVVVSSVNEPQKVNCGVTLEVEPTFKDGKILLSGKSTVRRHETPAEKQPLNALSFTARETFFDGEVGNDQPLTIQTGDGVKDKSQIILTAKRVKPAGTITEKHNAPPNYHVYAVNPSPEDAKKPIFQLLNADSEDTSPIAVAGIFSPEDLGPEHAKTWQPVEASLREIPAAEMPVKVSSTLGPDKQILDVKVQPVGESMQRFATNVSVCWGSNILLTVKDPTRPTGRRGLLIRQE